MQLKESLQALIMNKIEKRFCIFYMAYFAVYSIFFITSIKHVGIKTILPFHMFGMVISVVFLILIFRDLYKRNFQKPNTKMMWIILMLFFSPSIFIYLFKHGFKPRK